MEKMFPDRIVGIDAGRSVDEIGSDIINRMEQLLDQMDGNC